jgi:hypothetical protein
MAVLAQENQSQSENAKPTKEDSLVQIRKMMEAERLGREEERVKREAAEKRLVEVERLAQQALKSTPQADDDEDDDADPYVDKKKLNKKFSKFKQENEQHTEAKIEKIVQARLDQVRQEEWMKQNPDYYDVIQYAKELHGKDPELVDTIAKMPDGFERNKLVYRNIKLLGLHKAPEPQPSLQDKIDQNKRSPYYQPSGVSAPPYGAVTGGKDYSPAEGKNAYAKMKELQQRIRL